MTVPESGYNLGMVKRDRYGEPIEDEGLELVAWQPSNVHHREAARAALPPRDPDVPLYGLRREGLKTRLRAGKRQR